MLNSDDFFHSFFRIKSQQITENDKAFYCTSIKASPLLIKIDKHLKMLGLG